MILEVIQLPLCFQVILLFPRVMGFGANAQKVISPRIDALLCPPEAGRIEPLESVNFPLLLSFLKKIILILVPSYDQLIIEADEVCYHYSSLTANTGLK